MGQPEIDPDLRVHDRERLVGGGHHEGDEVPTGGVADHRHRGRVRGKRPRPADRHVTDLRQPEPTVGQHREPAVPGEADGLPVVLEGPEPGRRHLAPLALACSGGEEVPIGHVEVRQCLLEHDRRDLAQPLPFPRALRLGDDPLGQFAVRDVGQTVLPRGPACAQPVVEHHPGAPERLRQRLPLTTVRVRPVVVTKSHRGILAGAAGDPTSPIGAALPRLSSGVPAHTLVACLTWPNRPNTTRCRVLPRCPRGWPTPCPRSSAARCCGRWPSSTS